MTVKELRHIAKGIPGITGISTMKKAELLAKINEAQDTTAAKPKKKHEGVKKSLKMMTLKDIKKEILQLRHKKIAAQKDGDKNNIDIMRRKISRLKKLSRKVVNT